jgi:hypothetical protein
MYGFRWINDRASADYGAYCHPLFQRGKNDLCIEMTRQKIKGTGKSSKKTKIQRQTKGSEFAPELQPTSSTDISTQREQESSIRRVSLDEDAMKHAISHSLGCKIPEETNILSRAEGHNHALVESNQTMQECLEDNKQFRRVMELHDDCAQAISNLHLLNILSPLNQNEAAPMDMEFAAFLAGRVADKIDSRNSFPSNEFQDGDASFFEGRRFFSVEL